MVCDLKWTHVPWTEFLRWEFQAELRCREPNPLTRLVFRTGKTVAIRVFPLMANGVLKGSVGLIPCLLASVKPFIDGRHIGGLTGPGK